MQIEKAVKTLGSLDGFISLNQWMDGLEVHMSAKGLRDLHTIEKLEKTTRTSSEYPIRYSFKIGDADFFTLSDKEVDYFESVIENQATSV